MCACACACVRACVRLCVCVCVCAWAGGGYLASVTKKVRGTPAGTGSMPAGRTVTMSRRACTARPCLCILT